MNLMKKSYFGTLCYFQPTSNIRLCGLTLGRACTIVTRLQ